MFDPSGLPSKDRETFKKTANLLLSGCFICRKNESTKNEYYFAVRYRKELSEYFEFLGGCLELNEEYGVVHLVNTMGYNRLSLKLFDSIILLILRILIDEKKRQLNPYDIIAEVGEIQEKFMALKIRDRLIDKTTLNNSLRLFKKLNLIEPLDGDLTREDSRILLSDALLLAVRAEDIRRVYQKIEIYRKGEENLEETYESQAD